MSGVATTASTRPHAPGSTCWKALMKTVSWPRGHGAITWIQMTARGRRRARQQHSGSWGGGGTAWVSSLGFGTSKILVILPPFMRVEPVIGSGPVAGKISSFTTGEGAITRRTAARMVAQMAYRQWGSTRCSSRFAQLGTPQRRLLEGEQPHISR